MRDIRLIRYIPPSAISHIEKDKSYKIILRIKKIKSIFKLLK
jgi:hypothetical protein